MAMARWKVSGAMSERGGEPHTNMPICTRRWALDVQTFRISAAALVCALKRQFINCNSTSTENAFVGGASYSLVRLCIWSSLLVLISLCRIQPIKLWSFDVFMRRSLLVHCMAVRTRVASSIKHLSTSCSSVTLFVEGERVASCVSWWMNGVAGKCTFRNWIHGRRKWKRSKQIYVHRASCTRQGRQVKSVEYICRYIWFDGSRTQNVD